MGNISTCVFEWVSSGEGVHIREWACRNWKADWRVCGSFYWVSDINEA